MDFIEIIKDLIINLSLLTAYLFACSQLFKKDYIRDIQNTRLSKVWIGTREGLLGSLLMIFTVHFSNITILDFRQLAIIASGLGAGFYGTLISSAIIFLVRLFAFGPITITSFIAAFNTLVIGISVGFILIRIRGYWKKWTISLMLCITSTSLVFISSLGGQAAMPVIIFALMMMSGGLYTAYLLYFLVRSNTNVFHLQGEASTDFLTGLANVRMFDLILNEGLKKAAQKGENFSLLIIDIDYFKKINDTYGHLNGDTVLAQLGELLRKHSQSFGNIARIGGEEFAVTLNECPHQDAVLIGEQIRIAVQNNTFTLKNGKDIKITISVGLASYPEVDPDKLKEQADLALYKAKARGRNQICGNSRQ